LANIALPRLKPLAFKPLAVLRKPAFAVTAAGALFVAAAAALAALVGPLDLGGQDRGSLQAALHAAPAGWLQALRPAAGPLTVTPDVMRLSERPLAVAGGVSWEAGAPPARTYAGGPLPAAPIGGFFAPGPAGPLPIIAQDGRTPAEAYARPFHPNGRPKVALMVGGLGLNARATRQAIETLRPEITLSFVVYAEGLQGWIDMARAHGHEVLIEAPLEPMDYPENDPGAWTLMTDAQPPETVKKLEWILSRASGYFGLTNYLGSRFLADGRAYEAFASGLRGRGLAFIDDGAAASQGGRLPRASAERVIDDKLSAAAIDQQLLALEAGALQHGQALGAGFAYPVTLEKVARWADEVEQRGYQLAPASALMAKR